MGETPTFDRMISRRGSLTRPPIRSAASPPLTDEQADQLTSPFLPYKTSYTYAYSSIYNADYPDVWEIPNLGGGGDTKLVVSEGLYMKKTGALNFAATSITRSVWITIQSALYFIWSLFLSSTKLLLVEGPLNILGFFYDLLIWIYVLAYDAVKYLSSWTQQVQSGQYIEVILRTVGFPIYALYFIFDYTGRFVMETVRSINQGLPSTLGEKFSRALEYAASPINQLGYIVAVFYRGLEELFSLLTETIARAVAAIGQTVINCGNWLSSIVRRGGADGHGSRPGAGGRDTEYAWKENTSTRRSRRVVINQSNNMRVFNSLDSPASLTDDDEQEVQTRHSPHRYKIKREIHNLRSRPVMGDVTDTDDEGFSEIGMQLDSFDNGNTAARYSKSRAHRIATWLGKLASTAVFVVYYALVTVLTFCMTPYRAAKSGTYAIMEWINRLSWNKNNEKTEKQAIRRSRRLVATVAAENNVHESYVTNEQEGNYLAMVLGLFTNTAYYISSIFLLMAFAVVDIFRIIRNGFMSILRSMWSGVMFIGSIVGLGSRDPVDFTTDEVQHSAYGFGSEAVLVSEKTTVTTTYMGKRSGRPSFAVCGRCHLWWLLPLVILLVLLVRRNPDGSFAMHKDVTELRDTFTEYASSAWNVVDNEGVYAKSLNSIYDEYWTRGQFGRYSYFYRFRRGFVKGVGLFYNAITYPFTAAFTWTKYAVASFLDILAEWGARSIEIKDHVAEKIPEMSLPSIPSWEADELKESATDASRGVYFWAWDKLFYVRSLFDNTVNGFFSFSRATYSYLGHVGKRWLKNCEDVYTWSLESLRMFFTFLQNTATDVFHRVVLGGRSFGYLVSHLLSTVWTWLMGMWMYLPAMPTVPPKAEVVRQVLQQKSNDVVVEKAASPPAEPVVIREIIKEIIREVPSPAPEVSCPDPVDEQKLVSDITAKVRAEMEIKLKSIEETMLSSRVEIDKKQDLTDLEAIVRKELHLYDADKTGLFDYALESAGASVISTRCSDNYNSYSRLEKIWNIPLWYSSYGPRTVIQRNSMSLFPGECWSFKSGRGFLTVELSHPVNVSAVSYEHIGAEQAPDGNRSSAPKTVKFWAYKSENDFDTRFLLGSFTYDLEGSALQFFRIPKRHQPDYAVKIMEMEITSNYGAEYTCLYRMRVHGSLWKKGV